MASEITLLVGTTKGAFLLRSDARRESWAVDGPHCAFWSINHVIGEAETGRIWAAGGGGWEGAGVWTRAPDGAWSRAQLAAGARNGYIEANPEEAAELGMTADPPSPFDGEIDAIWSLSHAHGRLYAGAKPANLYVSEDGGATWTRLEGLAGHRDREGWSPGGAGLTLHTITPHPEDPARMWIGISAAGVFQTEDAGASWTLRGRQAHEGAGESIGSCVHNMVWAGGERLYQQNHNGVFHSPDGGRGWEEVTAGLPSSFGFPIAVHPADPETIWVVPLNGDTRGRFPPGAAAAVWRSRDAGANWTDLRAGLPQEACYFTVLRQAMATDRAEAPGLYFGTNSGSIFVSLDEGDHWREIARHLPTVLSVETMTL